MRGLFPRDLAMKRATAFAALLIVIGFATAQDKSVRPDINKPFENPDVEFPFKTLASIHEALRPGGQLVLVDFKRGEGKTLARRLWVLSHVRAGQEVVTREVVSVGFKLVGEEKLLEENYFLRFEKVER